MGARYPTGPGNWLWHEGRTPYACDARWNNRLLACFENVGDLYRPADTGGEITASGLKMRKGLAGIDPRYIPYFTKMYVPGYGMAIAADTGGGIQPRWIDLAYLDDEYVPWHQYVTVYFLWPPPANIVYLFP